MKDARDAGSVENPGRLKGLPQWTHVSPELYLGTRVKTTDGDGGIGLVRGVKVAAPLVLRAVKLIDGQWPRDGELMNSCISG